MTAHDPILSKVPLIRLGQLLRDQGYRFTTTTPETHARVNRRPGNERARTLRDVFGWSRPFDPSTFPSEVVNLADKAGILVQEGELVRSTVRFSTAERMIFVHSSFPTTQSDAVFFGPDTYRYLHLLRQLQPSARRALDVGCGSGAGGIVIAPRCGSVLLGDVNERAIEFSEVNAAINGTENAGAIQSDILNGADGPIDLIISNPPYLVDDHARLYRDGGGDFGEGLSIRIVRESLSKLTTGGRLILYTASGIVEGRDTFRDSIETLISRPGLDVSYGELDPDVFGEELDRPAYRTVDRLAVVALDVTVR